jgi:regulation of enolase protein 1 (concanavalin A-like superfamily)
MTTGMAWLNEPRDWSDEDGTIRVVTEAKTDFWRKTFYPWTTDSGHFYHRSVTGDFTAEVTVAAEHTTLFDQAGLMLRADEQNWVKSGVELTSGAVHVSTVLTREFSDLSTVPVDTTRGPVSLRLTRFGDAVAVHAREAAADWRLVRLAHLPMGDAVQAGVMCCSPERAGLVVEFRGFQVGDPISRDGLE